MVYRQMAAVSSFFSPLPLAGVLCVFMVEREVFHQMLVDILDWLEELVGVPGSC
jgi:hypothetical protein